MLDRLGNPRPNPGWLAKRTEQAIEPALPIVDAHHHLWDAQDRYLLDEFLADLDSGHNVRATVYVDAGAMYREDGPAEFRSVGEVEFANGVAAASASGRYGATRVCAAIVGHADLRTGDDLGRLLDALERAGGDRFRGIRHVAARDEAVRTTAPEGLLNHADFRRGFRVLQDRGLSFDAWVYHPQLGDLVALMRENPEARVALNHIGGRIGVGRYGSMPGEIARWRGDLERLAEFPNLNVKIGGLGMALCGFGFHLAELPPTSADLADAWLPYVDTVINIFGAQRCMFESNFPVDKASCSYVALWNAFKLLTRNRPAGERSALFSGTASRFYRLD